MSWGAQAKVSTKVAAGVNFGLFWISIEKTIEKPTKVRQPTTPKRFQVILRRPLVQPRRRTYTSAEERYASKRLRA